MPEPDAKALVHALVAAGPGLVERVRAISPEIADMLAAIHRHAERTRLLLKDQLRMLVFCGEADFAVLAAAELLEREGPATLRAVGGFEADIGYDDRGDAHVEVRRPGPVAFPWWVPAGGTA